MALKNLAHGALAGVALLAFYFAVTSFFQGSEYAVKRFLELWYLMVPLVLGFGFQAGLFSSIRAQVADGKAAMASAGTSGASMVACCAHHVTDLVPVLGASALGVFLLEYQAPFLVLGVASNVAGIVMMLNAARETRVVLASPFLDGLRLKASKQAVSLAIAFGFLAVVFSFLFTAMYSTAPQTPNLPVSKNAVQGDAFESFSQSKNSLDVDVTPLTVSSNEVVFDVAFNTHSVELDFDVLEVAVLDVGGVEFKPLKWEGSEPGGHHRSGKLYFGGVSPTPSSFKLVLRGVAGADWEFSWP